MPWSEVQVGTMSPRSRAIHLLFSSSKREAFHDICWLYLQNFVTISYTRSNTPAWKKVATKASKLAKKQWNKIPVEEQLRLSDKEEFQESSTEPLAAGEKVPLPGGEFQKPDEWKFIDDQLPAIFQE